MLDLKTSSTLWTIMRSKMLVIPALLLLLGGSIALNFVLFGQAKKYYLEVNQTRLDPNGSRRYSELPEPSPDQLRVVFFGDSRAENWTALELKGYEFINRGIGSQTSVQVMQRLQQHVRSVKPQVVVVQVGINDLKTIALFPDQKAEIIANCRSHIEQIVRELRAIGAIVILTTIFPVGEVPLQRKPFWSDDIGEAVKEMNRDLASLAGDRVIVLDAFSILADAQGMLRSDYRIDELHLSPAGYAQLNQALTQQLATLKPRKIMLNQGHVQTCKKRLSSIKSKAKQTGIKKL